MLRNRTQLVLCPLTRAIAWLERSTQHQSLVPMSRNSRNVRHTFAAEDRRAREPRLFSAASHETSM
jgi:hypothetical protein